MYSDFSESKEILKNCINYYLSEMDKLHSSNTNNDLNALDIEDWYVARVLINIYLYEKDFNFENLKNELYEYLGDNERINLVLSYFFIIKYLLDNEIDIIL